VGAAVTFSSALTPGILHLPVAVRQPQIPDRDLPNRCVVVADRRRRLFWSTCRGGAPWHDRVEDGLMVNTLNTLTDLPVAWT